MQKESINTFYLIIKESGYLLEIDLVEKDNDYPEVQQSNYA